MNLPAEEQNPSSMKANMEKKKPAASFVFTLSKNERDWMDKASDACLEDDILSLKRIQGNLFSSRDWALILAYSGVALISMTPRVSFQKKAQK